MHHSSLAASATYKLLACGLLALLADFLFYGHRIGWTMGLFCFTGLLVAFLFTPNSQWRMKCIVASLTFGQCLALVEHPNSLSFFLAVGGIVSTAISHNMQWHQDALRWWRCTARLLLGVPMRVLRDNRLFGQVKARHTRRHGKRSWLRGWILPVLFGITFLILLSEANPVIDRWVSRFDMHWLGDLLSVPRLLFFFFVLGISWAILRAKFSNPRIKAEEINTQDGWIGWLFSEQAVLRSLILFNLLFATQTAMDVFYLWAGGELPKGMNYAQYAQRGAYPLVATALLAAVFVLTVYRRQAESRVSKLAQGLIYLWLGQNILLVFSSITRLSLYIESYSLTYLRLSALIWMGIVAIGLMLICFRIREKKNNRWLINHNVLVLLATLYLCGFMPFGRIIAEYNLTHSRELTGKGAQFDSYYLNDLGPQGWEAITRYRHMRGAYGPQFNAWGSSTPEEAAGLTHWRTWTFENHRIVKRIHALQAGARP